MYTNLLLAVNYIFIIIRKLPDSVIATRLMWLVNVWSPG